MAETYYRTGQAAKQLGVSSYHVRRLCEAGEIEAEISAGQQWKISAAEIARLLQQGVPPIPVMINSEAEEVPEKDHEPDAPEEHSYSEPSARVMEAADDLKITDSRLQKRRLEREIEEVEDFFRERQTRQAAEEAAERQRVESAQIEQRRLQWIHQWTEYAFSSLPRDLPREVELEVHGSVQQALSGLQMGQPAAITTRLVQAAVERALRPWKRKQEIERAVRAGMAKLAWEVRHGSDFAELKQRAWRAAAGAISKLHENANYDEKVAAASWAVEPIDREYQHLLVCKRILTWTFVVGASDDEQDAAKEAVRKALTVQPVGVKLKQLEQVKETALVPFKAAVVQREKAAQQNSEQRARRRDAEWKAETELSHIARYLQQEFDFDGEHAEMCREAARLRPLIREALIENLLQNPNMSGEDIRNVIEDLIEDGT